MTLDFYHDCETQTSDWMCGDPMTFCGCLWEFDGFVYVYEHCPENCGFGFGSDKKPDGAIVQVNIEDV